MSQADSHSNKTSDFDFPDVQQEDIDEELILMKPEWQGLEMRLILALNKWTLTDTTVGNFGKYNIQFSQLSFLSREDLIKLGVTDSQMQDEMLQDFSQLQGQDPNTMRPVIGDIQEERRENETMSMVQTLQNQIYHLNTLLAAITFRVGTTSASSPGIVVNQRFCSTQVVMDLLGQLSDHTAEMEQLIVSLADPERFEEIEREYARQRYEKRRNCIALASTVGLFIAGLYFARRFGMRKAF